MGLETGGDHEGVHRNKHHSEDLNRKLEVDEKSKSTQFTVSKFHVLY